MRVVILHGLGGNGPGHWQTWLAGELRVRGEDVLYPDLPNPMAPTLAEWLAELDAIRRPGDVLVCHSLACALYLHHDGPPAERALLVTPPCRDVPELTDFFPVPTTHRAEAHLVGSDNDEWCPRGAVAVYGAVAASTTVLSGAAHINPESGFGPWPFALDWCYGAKNGVET